MSEYTMNIVKCYSNFTEVVLSVIVTHWFLPQILTTHKNVCIFKRWKNKDIYLLLGKSLVLNLQVNVAVKSLGPGCTIEEKNLGKQSKMQHSPGIAEKNHLFFSPCANTLPTSVYFYFLERAPTFYEVQELKTLLDNQFKTFPHYPLTYCKCIKSLQRFHFS